MHYILEQIYPDDVLHLTKNIRLRLIDDYLIQSRIAANPHMEKDAAEEFIESLVDERRELVGFERMEDQLDRVGLANLKEQMAQSRRFKVT